MTDKQPARRRVCIVGSGWQFTSGISYYTCRLATILDEEFDVSVILMRRLIPRRLYPGRDRVGVAMHGVAYPERVRVYDGVDWFWLPSMLGAIRFLRRQRPEVIVLQWWTGAVLHSYLLLAMVAKLIGAKVVIEFHETQDTGEAKLRGAARYVAALGQRLWRHGRAFVVHSTFDRDRVESELNVGHGRIHVLPHGPFDHHIAEPDPALAAAAEADAAGAGDAGADAPFNVLFFGTIRPYKGLEFLVEAFNGLTDEQAAQFRLTVVGETWEGWTGPLELIRTSPHADRITLVNRYVHDNEVSQFFGTADAVILPYTRSSASGPLHIAMAYGLPTVLTDVGGLREGAAGYDGILWVPPNSADEIKQALLELPARRGTRYADPRSWSDSLHTYRSIVEELRGGSDSARPAS